MIGRVARALVSLLAAATLVASAPPRAQSRGVASTATVQAVKVWVNTSSKVYHCPGTRYYGKSKRGQFMTEQAALTAGMRPAGGRSCGGSAAQGGEANPLLNVPGSTSTIRVWVNASSRVYHCPGARYYGKTKRGSFMTEAAARASGNRPANGRACAS